MRVLIVDDHPMYREGLIAALSGRPGVTVVGEAGDGAAAVELAVRLAPDVVLMDLHMPVMNGVEATGRLRAELPDVAVVVLTMLESDESLAAAVRAGARGYLLKGAGRAEILRALEACRDGGAYFGPNAARALAGLVGAETRRSVANPVLPDLTEREVEILDLMARGLSNAAIASRLYVSDKTVRNYVSTVYGKLDVGDRAAAVARARDAGLGAGLPGGR
ncbi:response regulator transcription factor [Microbispora cellulosiformans]|uniref:Response regulator transcription factor n=1 Tax=Microbispora cellulosiformans TaxID=2614688 RepID=A0A5J5JXB4_9ACTN|nr:response regulator transcription factor [Microbispora cellulosiformans]KAA9376042.1 response regulator transcription factor [Microbispora cellulosiformans]